MPVARPTTVVIGAGPYGLSVAAHLRCASIEFRIFGTPMERWRAQMPRGMFLKSEGCASSLADPTGFYALSRYCAEQGLPYGDYGVPVPLETFTQYGLSFQRRLVPTLEEVMVSALERSGDGFTLRLASGETIRAGTVVVATGLSHTAHLPAVLAWLPSELISHSAAHHDLAGFKGKDVAVIGGGQSALETAALLAESGASVRLIVRRPSLAWNPRPRPHRSLFERLRYPATSLGPGLGNWIYANAPMLFYHLPPRIRVERVRTALGPAGAWWLKDRVVGRLPILFGHLVRGAEVRDGRVLLHLQGPDGESSDVEADHVIAGTGYRVSLPSLPFLSQRLISAIRCVGEMPRLSHNFESTVRGLYFTGLPSANSFGPAMRFVHGAHYTARVVSGHILSSRRPSPVLPSAAPAAVAGCQGF